MRDYQLNPHYSPKVFFAIAIPIIIQGLVFQLQNIVDKAFLGNLRTEYLTAIGVTQSPFFMTTTIIMAIATGLSIIVGHQFGAKELSKMKNAIGSTIGYNFILSLMLLGIWVLFGESILRLINVEESIIPIAMVYLKIISLYLPFYAVDSSIQAALQAYGITKPIMYIGMVKVFLNVFLDWVLIFGKFGFPAMGIQGAAIATLIANVTASCILILYFTSTKQLPIQMHIKELFRFGLKVYRRIVAIGLPTGLEFFLWHLGNLVLISFLNQIDTKGVAVYVLTSSVGILVFMIYIGFSKATMTLISQRLGAKDYDSTRAIMKRSMGYNLVVITLFVGAVTFFTEPILGIFTSDSGLISLTMPVMVYLLITLYPKSINVLIGHGIRAMGKTKWMLYTQVIGTALVIGLSWFLVVFLKLGLEAIFITIMIDEGARSLINTWYFINKTHVNKIKDNVVHMVD